MTRGSISIGVIPHFAIKIAKSLSPAKAIFLIYLVKLIFNLVFCAFFPNQPETSVAS